MQFQPGLRRQHSPCDSALHVRLFVWLLLPAMHLRIEDADFSAKKIWLAGRGGRDRNQPIFHIFHSN